MAVRNRILRYVNLAPVLGLFVLLLWLPEAAAEGARQGLGLCASVVVPSLLPFLIFSGLAAALGLPGLLAGLCAPALQLLRVPPVCAAPLLLGLLGGYPVGAAALAELVKRGELSPAEAARALPWCNNTGPGFIVGFVGGAVFGAVRAGLVLWLCHALASLVLAALSGRRSPIQGSPQPSLQPTQSLAAALPESVRAAAANMLFICAYVVFFSVLSAFLRAAGLSSPLLCGILELSQGIGAMRGLPPTPGNAACAAFLLGFGGLSVHCQTLCAVSEAKIKCARHFTGRIVHGLISALLAYVLFTLLQI